VGQTVVVKARGGAGRFKAGKAGREGEVVWKNVQFPFS